ncbi:MAG: type II secretion system F family protein [bacterium]|nr:type II secretion system F family protein [bacterium]
MPTQFEYQAVGSDGSRKEGNLSAEDKERVVELLVEQGLIPIEIKAGKPKGGFTLFGFFKGQDYEDLIAFTNNLSTLFRAGIPILRALNLIKIGSANSPINKAINQIKMDVQSGKSLARAMGVHDTIFNRVYISSIAAGEESGKLDEILGKLSPMLEKELALARQIKSGIRYPAMVIGAIAAAFVVLLAFVVPRFVAFFDSFNTELPLPTRILIGTSDFFQAYWIYLLAGLIALFLGFRKLIRTEKGKLWVDGLLLKIPVVGQIITKGNVARFALMFSILLKAGIPIVRTLELLQESVKNSVIGGEIRKLGILFREGQEQKLLGSEFEHLPEMALQMMRIGLESGSLDTILSEVGEHYSKEVQYASSQITAILEPILTLVLGVFVLIMALAIFMPMWNLIQVIKG